MTKIKPKKIPKKLKFDSFARKAALSIFLLVFVVIGVKYFVLSHALTVNQIQLDNGTCTQNLQQGTNPTYSAVTKPSFLMTGDGALSSYNVSIDGNAIGTFNSNGYGNVCITTTTALSQGAHTITAQEIKPTPSNTVPAFTFTIDSTPLATPTNLILDPNSDTGVQGDNTTTLTNPDIEGTGPDSATIQILDNGVSEDGGALSLANGSFIVATSGLSVGTNVLTAVSVSPAGVESAPSSPLTITVDSPVLPAISISSPAANSSIPLNSIASLSVNATDSSYPIWEVKYILNGNLNSPLYIATASPFSYSWNTAGYTGNQTLTAVAEDTAGDTTTSAPITFSLGSGSVQPTAPGTPATTSPTSNTSPTFTWAPSTDSGGPGLLGNPYTLQYSTDPTFNTKVTTQGGITNPYATLVDLGVAETWYVRVEATDVDGNTSAWSSVGSVTVEQYPLTVIINSPTSGQTLSGTVPVTGTIVDSNPISSIKLYIDGTLVATATSSPFNFSWNTLGPIGGNGSDRLEVYATDSAGNSGNDQFLVNVANGGDTTPPTVSLTTPTPGQTVSGIVPVSATASDNVGVTQVEFFVDGTLTATDTSAPYNFSWNSTNVSNGSHNLLTEAFDGAGNTSSAQANVTVANIDTTPPSTPTGLSATAPLYNQVNLNWTGSTDSTGGGGIAGYYIMRNTTNNLSGATTIQQTTTSATTYQDTSSTLAGNTTYYYWVMAYDGVGNDSLVSADASVTTPVNPSTIPPDPPTSVGSLANTAAQVNLTWTASDSTNVTGYNVYRGLSATTIGSTAINGPNPVTADNYGDSGLTPNTNYCYDVEAVNGTLSSVASSPPYCTSTAPLPPTSTTVQGQVTSKTAPAGLKGVTVHTNKSGAGGVTTATTDPTGNYTLNGIVSNSLHKYTFSLKGYKTINTKAISYPVGTVNLDEVLVKKK